MTIHLKRFTNFGNKIKKFIEFRDKIDFKKYVTN